MLFPHLKTTLKHNSDKVRRYSSILIVLIFSLFGCKSKQETSTSETVSPYKPAPTWVTQRPKSLSNYIGIGMAEKSSNGSYTMEAKKNALYDLSSEIKVKISSNSVLYTVQNDNKFNESFNSLITMSNSEQVEGYEIVDSYENEKQYWVYYSLSREKYEEQKAKKKQQIVEKAENIIESALNDEQSNDLSSSLRKKIKAFGILEPYLGEEVSFNTSKTKGIKNILDLSTQIQKQLQSITIKPINSLNLKPFQNSYEPVAVTFQINGKGYLQNFPFEVISENDKIEVSENTLTNSSGEASLKLNSVKAYNTQLIVSLKPDIIRLVGSDSMGLNGSQILSQFVQTPSLKIVLNASPIKIFINSSENNLGKPTGSEIIETYFRNYFQGNEFIIVENKNSADYILDLKSDTREDISSETLNGVFNLKLASLFINAQLQKNNSDFLHKIQSSDVFGYGNTLNAAGMNAYQAEKLSLVIQELAFQIKRQMVNY